MTWEIYENPWPLPQAGKKRVFQMEIKRCPACYFCWFLHLDAPHLDNEAATSDDFSDEAAWWSLTPWTRDALAECARSCRVQSLRVVVACSCMVHNSARKWLAAVQVGGI
jgi:hypothetical protein